jgi:hypothetical protein
MQLALSVYYNQDPTKKKKKDKKHHDLITASGSAPPNVALYPEFATIMNRRGTSTGNTQKGDSLGTVLVPTRTLPCPLCKGNHWRSKCPHLQVEGGVPPPVD